MTARKLEDYRLGDKVEVKTAADPDNWYPDAKRAWDKLAAIGEIVR